MKILFLVESMSSRSGGPTNEIARITDLLTSNPCLEITVACLRNESDNVLLNEKVNYYYFNVTNLLLNFFRVVKELHLLIKESDVIFSTGIWGPVDGLALRLAWITGKPVYLRICGMLEPYIVKRNVLKKWFGFNAYLKSNLNKATGVIVNSEDEAQHVKLYVNEEAKIRVIPNGVEIQATLYNKVLAKQHLGLSLSMPTLLYLGRIHPKKGLHLLLEAILHLPNNKRNFILVVAGEFSDNNYKTKIENIIYNNQLQTIVKFSGLVTGHDKDKHFAAADMFILPSQSEGLPNAALEAMACGLPVILTKECNMSELANYGAGIIINLSIEDIVDSIEWFLLNHTNLLEMSNNAKQYILDKFNPDASRKLYMNIISSHIKDYNLLVE
ncbi:glycosyltransferase [Spirosoma fluminis]